MKRNELIKYLRRNGCFLKREGVSHSLWCNPLTGHIEAVPRHIEIPNRLARKICKALSIKEIGYRDQRTFSRRGVIQKPYNNFAAKSLKYGSAQKARDARRKIFRE